VNLTGLHDYLNLSTSKNRRTADRFFLRAETVFELASKLDGRDRVDPSARDLSGEASLHTRSHGEAFLPIVQNRLRRKSFFLMDEPKAALSPSRIRCPEPQAHLGHCLSKH
jgi:predicted ATPase